MDFKKRADKTFEKYGESFLINETTPAKGFFQQLDQARMSMFFDSIEQASILRPALVLMVAADTSVAVDDSITRDDRTYTVTKMAKIRVKDTVVMQVLVLT